VPDHPRHRSGASSQRSSDLTGRENVAALSALQRAADAFPQTTHEQQLALHAVFRAGVAARQQLEAGRLSGLARTRAIKAAREGERAFEVLVGSNQRLVRLICREQAENRFGRERAASYLPDLVAEGNVALVEAVTSFDPSRSPKFSSYAGAMIRTRIRTEISREDSPVDVPSSWRRLKRIAAVRGPKLTEALGRPPSTEELQADLTAYCLAWAASKLTPEQQALPDAQRHELAMAKVRKQGTERAIRDIEKVLQLTQGARSLDAPVTDDGSRTLGDGLTSAGGQEGVVEALGLEAMKAAIAEALSQLDERERRIVEMRYGFGAEDGAMMTYNEICSSFGVTAERVRQIEVKVLSKLRELNPELVSRLASFLPELEGVDLDGRAEEMTTRRRRR
jgi:RNA polymerase primary sigma factor